MHKSRLGTLIIDCQTNDLVPMAKFWAEALGLTPENPDKLHNPKFMRLEGRDGEVQILLQAVDHESRVHIDIETDDKEAEVARLQGLGAAIVSRTENWTVMEAPSGHRFCIIDPIREGFEELANTWPT